MSKRIFIIYTGGTIGMVRSPQGYVAVSGLQKLIDEKIPPRLSMDMPDYDLFEYPDPIDSSNIRPPEWARIAKDISDRYDDYDGFVVLHGTDTMAYTASALSFLLRDLTKPVIVTGSQIPLSELRNDAQTNLVTAIELASSYNIPEVCLYFNGVLLRGNRSSKLLATGFEAFASPNYPHLADVGIYIELNQHALLPVPDKIHFELPDYNFAQVRVLSLYPGIEAEVIEAMTQTPCRALILRTYGVGNGPSLDKPFLKALEQAHRRGVVLTSLTQCTSGSVNLGSYAAGSELAKTGLLGGGDMTVEAAFAKLHHLCALGLSSDEIRRAISKPRAGEITTKKSI
ncbi:L-asparaginase/archaeal Glu-tRNAGln amidotransferase subunit D [Hahella chejuensis KCTC 2396]|uniref:asparaginase n=1 Tax=Hahella chejuensis (strain KCTC 2396) TaxID=349521 RepID=Q2S7U3_HAHCH|nr:asparaginase [Hahella chejuensis]ABC33281.1 L-asparaginase/archaeal Glu-tRNAGln amidotransferase subunit D [Hahella chejuensis KCTC 2396]